MNRRVAWFIAVGGTAATVHFGVVLGLVSIFGVPPLLANPGGWVCAVGVSFLGHHLLTFSAQRAPASRAARRFVALSAAGLAINEAAYALLLHGTGIGYQMALALVLAGVAVLTYWMAKRWAFAQQPSG